MPNRTDIEWVKNPDGTQGYTWNPLTGCENHTPEGLCLGGMFPCYAWRLANGRLRERYLANRHLAIPRGKQIDAITLNNAYSDPFYPRFWPERLEKARKELYRSKPKGIFVCDMSDLFGIGIPEKWTNHIMSVIKSCQEHHFYLLTKQPQNLPQWSPFPDNCWVGVTVTNEGKTYPDMFEEACRALADIKASVKYISFEPLQTSIYKLDLLKIWGIDWVIIGAQTKPYKPPKIEWVEEIVRAADKAGIPVFLKDNLRPLIEVKSTWPSIFRDDYMQLRQEILG